MPFAMRALTAPLRELRSAARDPNENPLRARISPIRRILLDEAELMEAQRLRSKRRALKLGLGVAFGAVALACFGWLD